ncbi:nucleoside monophosphate kinase, partial [Buchnera aphidicola]|nr:nucleoside monophosphate kinase [Buchnera aphidicola]
HTNLKNEMGVKIIDTINQGKLVSDTIVCSLVKSRINKKDCINGFLLDGFPRTIKQAQYISKSQIKIDYVLEFLIPHQIIFERISGRRIHKNSGRTYHIKFNPPKIENRDDITGELLITREDDKIDIIKKRLKENE